MHIMNQSTRTGAARGGALDRLDLSLTPGAASVQRLPAMAHDRRLQVLAGTVWLTRSAAALSAPAAVLPALVDPGAADLAGRDERDLWLQAGDSLDLPRGSGWIVQAWPAAELRLSPLPRTVLVLVPEGDHGQPAHRLPAIRRWLRQALLPAQLAGRVSGDPAAGLGCS
jgi:hypothetical protein